MSGGKASDASADTHPAHGGGTHPVLSSARLILLLGWAALLLLCSPLRAGEPPRAESRGVYLIQVASGHSAAPIRKALSDLGLRAWKDLYGPSVRVELHPDPGLEALREALAPLPAAESVQPEFRYHADPPEPSRQELP
ncbi:hypothetical protein [Thiohalorhabdus methylotrophus]|uniref:Uncharacterized protein n=1 Tax=Thiohalorhabdus methylotrophus TaxID=3242694 RepID=A0ABV4TUA5_9GAMM